MQMILCTDTHLAGWLAGCACCRRGNQDSLVSRRHTTLFKVLPRQLLIMHRSGHLWPEAQHLRDKLCSKLIGVAHAQAYSSALASEMA